jgi:glyoxylase I family protein
MEKCASFFEHQLRFSDYQFLFRWIIKYQSSVAVQRIDSKSYRRKHLNLDSIVFVLFGQNQRHQIMLNLNKIHHIAIICSDYEKSKHFYTQILGLEILQEIYREERQSYKLDLALNGNYVVELFSFPNPPKRLSHPEASGLRHLAFEVNDIESTRAFLVSQNILSEEIRTDEYTNKRFFFISDPDLLPIEFYQS